MRHRGTAIKFIAKSGLSLRYEVHVGECTVLSGVTTDSEPCHIDSLIEICVTAVHSVNVSKSWRSCHLVVMRFFYYIGPFIMLL